MKVYREYKNSNIEWIQEIPLEWRIIRVRSLVKSITSGIWGEEPLNNEQDIKCIRVADFEKFGTKSNEFTMRYVPHELKIEKRLLKEDLLIEKSGGGENQPVGRVIKYGSDQEAICSNFISILRIHANKILPDFLLYCFHIMYMNRVNIKSIKQTTGIQNLDLASYLNERIMLPSLGEQYPIVKCVNIKTSQIDSLIEKKKRLIELLKEYRSAIINHAVTKGLDPNVKMKDSGIEWIGQIPEHWRRVRIKNLSQSTSKSFIDGDWIETPYITNEGIRLIQTGNIGVGVYKEQGYKYISESTFEALACTEVYAGDVLICRLASPVGRACIAPNLGVRMITSVDNCILRTSDNYDSNYFVYQLSTQNYLDFMEYISRGGTRSRISRSMLGDISVLAPPYSEQIAISTYLDEKTSQIDSLIEKNKKLIELLKEYRKSIISDAVTGKIDVRGYDEQVLEQAK